MAYTTIDDPTQFFNTIIWSGDSSSPENLTVGFQPDLIWGKLRNIGYAHQLYDSVRGFGNDKDLQPSTNTAEGGGTADQYGYISGTTSTGFTATKGSDGGADAATVITVCAPELPGVPVGVTPVVYSPPDLSDAV